MRLGVKFNPEASAFKKALAAMKPGDTIFASGLAGDFVLPTDREANLGVGVEGGVGVLAMVDDRVGASDGAATEFCCSLRAGRCTNIVASLASA